MKTASTATKRSRPMGPRALEGSREAKRTAAVLLEVLAGVRGTQEGAVALGTSLSRYYVLETRALQGFISALEPRPKGRQRRPEDELESLRRDKRRLEQELGRSQALVRAAQRSLGVSAAAAEKKESRGKLAPSGRRRRRRRRTARAAGAIAALRRSAETEVESASPSEGRTEHARRTSTTESEARRRPGGHGRGQTTAALGTRDADG